MALIDDIEQDGLLAVVVLALIYFLGKKLIAGVTAGATYVAQAVNQGAKDYVGDFYTPANSYGADTVVTGSQDMSGPNGAASTATSSALPSQNPNPNQPAPNINTDPFIWGTSF